MTAYEAKNRAEEIIASVTGGTGYYGRLYDAIANALLLAQAEVYESIPSDWHDMPLLDFVQSRSSALRRAADEVKWSREA